MTNEEYQQIRNAKDLEIMRHPEHWPLSVLPLKQYGQTADGHTTINFSMLAKPADQFYHWVPEFSVGRPDFENSRLGRDELLVELIKQGWMVD
jgi:hypothetical protein